ncbi:complex I subunit 5 family protein [Halonatronum saccharophilum]|uniref:complex I subunit 5 family protein n=1 Tax=Halonatronum saccharophilum TaxID=150060 RepID=UPI000485F5CE|nr:proton-conducting transporter membrane subunit [Halonatronum saccharophilum]
MNTPIMLIVLPLLTAFVLGLANLFSKNLIRSIALTSAAVHIFLVGKVARRVLEEPIIYKLGEWDSFLGINLVIDSLSLMMALLISIISFLVLIYSLYYIKRHKLKYYIILNLLIAGMMGMVLTGDLFNLYVFFEIVSVTSYALVAIKDEGDCFEGAFKYLVMGSISGTFVLLAIILTYQTTGALNLAHVAANFMEVPFAIRQTIFVFFFIGFGTKFALVPLHAWMPDAYSEAVTPFNAISSALVIKTSLYAFMRIVYTLYGIDFINGDIGTLLIYWGVITFLVAHISAYKQDNLKRLFAYSSIAQIGYIMLGIGVGTENGIIAANFHIFNHGIIKSVLFLVLGIFIYTKGVTKIEDIKGLGFAMPKISFAFTLATLAMVGLPPFNGFISKWLILYSSLEGGYSLAAFFVLIGSLISLAYYLRIIKVLYSKGEAIEVQKVSWTFKFPIFVLTISSLLVGIFPQPLLSLIEQATFFLSNNTEYINLLLGG